MNFNFSLFSRTLLTGLSTVFALCLLASSAHALDKNQAETALEQIFQATISSYYSVNGFYNFSANQADQQQLAVINNSAEDIARLLEELEPVLSEGGTADTFSSVMDSWETYENVLSENISVVVDTGYPDLRLAGDMATTNISFNQALEGLYTNVINVSGATPTDATTKSRKAAKVLALMMTKYSARSTSTVSQVYTGGDTEITIDSLANEFEALMDSLAETVKDDEAAHSLLDSAITKWDFIRNSYINYNENRVNFIVNLYSKKIIADIKTATTKF